MRIGYLHPKTDAFLSSEVLESRIVRQLAPPHEIVDLPTRRGEWTRLEDLDFPALVRLGIDALYFSPRHYHALPFIARERGRLSVPLLVPAFSAARWWEVWLLAAPFVRPGDRILAPSHSAIREVRRIAPLEQALLLDRFALPVADCRRAAANARPPEDRIDLLFFGRVTEEKGVYRLVRALQRLPSRTHLRVVGPGLGYTLRTILELAHSLGVADRVSVEEPVRGPDKYRLLASASLFVLPTTYVGEAYPSAMVDAFSVGTPVVASDWAGIPEAVVPKKNGDLVPVRFVRGRPDVDDEELAHALRPLAEDDERRSALRAGALETGLEHDVPRARREILARLEGGRTSIEDRWETHRHRTLASLAPGCVAPYLLDVEARFHAAGGGTFGLPKRLPDLTLSDLVSLLDDRRQLEDWRHLWTHVFLRPLMRPKDPAAGLGEPAEDGLAVKEPRARPSPRMGPAL